MPNNNTNDTCDLDGSIESTRHDLEVIVYYIFTPIYFVIGTLTRGICLIAFYKQYKKEKAYVYQILQSTSDTLEILFVTLCVTTKNNLSGLRLPGALWFQENYFLMWYAARLASPTYNGFITASLLVALSTTIDRLIAISKPFVYKTMNHGRYQLITFLLSLGIGLSTSAFDVWRYQVVSKGDVYKIVVDEKYIATSAAAGMALLRDSIRVLGDLALICCNIAMVICYRKNRVTDDNEERTTKRKSTQRTLLLLTLSQSAFVTLDITLCNVYYILVYSSPRFTACAGKVMAPLLDLTVQISGILEFFALFAISKLFRNTILACLPVKNTIKVRPETKPAHSNAAL